MSNSLLTFTQALWHGTELVLSSPLGPTSDQVAESLRFLKSVEIEYRAGLPEGVPTANLPAAEWALVTLYRVSQFLVFRELPEEMLRTELARPCPEQKSAAVCYGVDLSFRFLPELVRLTRAVNSQDPLLEFLKAWAAEWPLSSVGVSDVDFASIGSESIEPILENAALRMMYIDRILTTHDASRLTNPQVAEAVRTALGDFRELSPLIYDLVYGRENQ
ncbi:MAG: hypothetical protein JWM11_5547 [Planctomycetaceae bacterium]|nr:hypothetical protein [Planctomycetaceae bacterium]